MSTSVANLRELELIFRQLAVATRAGLPLRETVAILRQDTTGPSARVLENVGRSLEQGGTLASALGDPAARFPPETVELVRRAEAGDFLADALEALAGDYERRALAQDSVVAVLMYPSAIAVLLVLVLCVLALFVMPALDQVYSNAGGEVYRTGAVLARSGPLLIVLAAAFIVFGALVVWMTLFRDSAPRGLVNTWDAVRLRIPVFGSFSKKAFEVRAAALLGVAVSRDSGFAAAALDHLNATSGNRKLGEWTQPLVHRLSAGDELVQSMRATPAVPRRIAAMLELASKTGDIAVTRELRDWYDVVLRASARTFHYRAMGFLYVVLVIVIFMMLFTVYVPIFGIGAIV